MFRNLFAKKTPPKPSIDIPVLCRFWCEDGVWNGSAYDLPVAVYGDNLEQAKKHLGEALSTHFDALKEVGEFDAVMSRLRHLANERGLRIVDMSDHELLWKTTAHVEDDRVTALV